MTTLPRRKRSAAAGLTAIGTAAMLSGCDPSPEELSRERFGAPTEVAAFNSVAECVASVASTSGEASSQIASDWSRISARVSSCMNAPPPVAMTFGVPSIRRAMTRRSPSRKCASPNRSKISVMVMPAACSIS